MKGLRIDEASGVDAPAHLAPGWMVIKSAAGGDPLEGLSDQEIADVIKALEAEQGEPVQELIESLTKALGTMAEPAKAQATALIAALGAEPAPGDDPVAKAVADALTKASAEREAAEKRATELEAELAKAKGAGETEEEALAKAMATLPEPVRKRLIADQERIAKAETEATEARKTAETEREARVSSEYLTKARGSEFAGLPIGAEALATALREIDEKVSKEAGAELTRVLKAAGHMARGGAADFAEFGGAGADVSSEAGARAQIEAAATELQKADPNLDRPTAIVKAYDAHPDLARAAQGGEG
jgi:hypothetical protein